MKRIVPLLLVLLLAFLTGCGGEDALNESTPAPAPSSEAPDPVDETPDIEASFCRACVYYTSDEGYLVPVTKLIPWEEGIASAVLKLMVSTPANVSAAKEMGLKTVIPDGTEASLSIADGNALVDLRGLPALNSAEEELAMVQAIVNTLLQFPTVNSVTVTRDGASGNLENGTELPVRHGEYELNPEETELAASTGGEAATLFFPNLSGALCVPVTRVLSSGVNIYSASAALIEGPKGNELLSCFPKDTLLLGATLENGVLTLNLSQDFEAVAQTEGLFTLCYNSVWHTLSGYGSFTKLRFQVNGRDFQPEAVSPPSDINALPKT